jgi:hypothetical protein
MKKMLLLLLLCPCFCYSQFISGEHVELKYDNFIGSGSSDFKTDMQGFGSINYNCGYDFNYSFGNGTVNPFINVGLGLATKIFRFKNDWIFDNQNGQLSFRSDDPSHVYSTDFFSYSKSKLNNSYFRFNPEIGIKISNTIMISGGPVIDVRLFIYQKNKYKIGDYRYSNELRRNNHFDSNLFHFGWKVNLGTPAIGVFATYMTTPFFKGTTFQDVYPLEIGIYFRNFKSE